MKTNYQLQNIAAGSQSQAYVDQSAVLTATTGTPGVGQFRSSIIGRASIPDIANDMRASLGIERISIQSLTLLQNEQGSNGEPVYSVVNDDRGLIRCVGYWVSIGGSSRGTTVYCVLTNDYVEIVFYGTGLNLITTVDVTRSFSVYLDGSLVSSSLYPSSPSNVLDNRGSNPNQILNIINNQTLGIHTVKVVNNSANAYWLCGFEILNSNASGYVNINPGTAYYQGKKIKNSSSDSITYNTGVTGTKGGRIVRYFTDTDTVTQAFTAVNASVAYGISADHTNEEVARIYMPREFGAGRYNAIYANQDDFSLMTSTGRSAAFTLDDGTTTLVSPGITLQGVSGPEGLLLGAAGSVTLTFVGCGLDILLYDYAAGGNDSYTYQIDGATATAWFNTAGNTALRVQKIVSGLAYGTHTFTLNRVTASTWAPVLVHFKVYQPKKPTLPTGAVEICDYNVMGNYVANTVAGLSTMATGVLRKQNTREFVYVNGTGGTVDWSIAIGTETSGFGVYTDRLNGYVTYTFLGTGCELRFTSSGNRSANVSVLLNNLAATTANFSTLVSSVYGTGVTFSSGTLDQYDVSVTTGSGLTLSGLPLGLYTIKLNNNTASSFIHITSIDIITPIHSYKNNLYADLQNTLTAGSQSLMDSRSTSPNPTSLTTPKVWAQAVGITSNPTTSTASFIPIPDMSLTIKTNGGVLDIYYSIETSSSAATWNWASQIYVDGLGITPYKSVENTAVYNTLIADNLIVPVSAGVHKVDVYWNSGNVGNTLTAIGARRSMKVREI
jgi:hypothetical protein